MWRGRDTALNTSPECPTLSQGPACPILGNTLQQWGVSTCWMAVCPDWPCRRLRAAIAHGHPAVLSGPGLDLSLPLSTDAAHQGHQEPGRGKPSAHLFLAITWVQFSTYGNSLSEFSQEMSLGPSRRAVTAHRSRDGAASGAFGPSGPHAALQGTRGSWEGPGSQGPRIHACPEQKRPLGEEDKSL